MTTRAVTPKPTKPMNARRWQALWWAVPAVAFLAAAVNGTIYVVASKLGAFPPGVIIPSAGVPMTLPPVLLTSAIGVIGGGTVFMLIGRFVKNPVRVFRFIGTVVLVLSFVTPFTIPAAPLEMRLTLELMHLRTALHTLWLLPAAVRR